MTLSNNKPKICAVGMFQPVYDIQIKSLMDVFSENGIESVKTTYYQSKIIKFFDILLFLPLKRRKYDIIHLQAHSRYNIISVIVALFWAKLLKKEIIVMYYGGAAKEFFSISPRFFRNLFSKVDKIVVAGKYVQSAFDDLGLKTVIIPHILNVEKWPYRHRDSSGAHLLWVRHLLKEFNPLMLLKLFKKLKATVPELKLRIIGKGDLQDEMERYIFDNSLTDIEMLGRVSDSELKSTLNWADIFLNTTNVDNQPVSVLEAMACGCPVVSTNPGGIPDIVTHKENGMLSDPGDIDAMAANIMLLFNDRELYSSLSSKGREFVENKFGKEVIFEQWTKIYAELGFSL